MSSARNEIIRLIPKLWPEEFADITKALKSSKQLNGHKAEEAKPDYEEGNADWLLSGIALYLSRHGELPAKNSVQLLQRRQSAYNTYKEKVPAVRQYLTKLERQLHTASRHRVQLGYICGMTLHELLTEWGVFSTNAMLTQIDKLPEAIERSYPNYVASGLFGYVLDQVEVE